MNGTSKRKELDFREYWRVIVKRKRLLMIFLGALIFFTAFFSFLAPKKYKSTATLLIEEESSKILSIDSTFGYQPQFYSMQDLRFFNTQLELLGSKSLAERVATKLNLSSHPEFNAGKKPKDSIEASAADPVDEKSAKSQEESKGDGSKLSIRSNPSFFIINAIQKDLIIKPVRETKMVEVSFISSDRNLAAEIVNTFAEEFINFSIDKRYEMTMKASDFLSGEIAKLNEEIAVKQRELQKYGQEKDLLFLSDTESTEVRRFADLNEAYTRAQVERYRAEAKYREIKDLKVDSMPQFVNNPAIQDLKTEYSRIKNEYDEKSEIFRDSYPEMIKIKARLESTKKELQNEIEKAVTTAESDYRSALKEENSLKSLLERQRGDVARTESNAILYNSLKIEVENSQKLLNSLLERQKETMVSARLGGLKTSNISIIDRGEIPRYPVSPKVKMNLFLAVFIGLFGGMGLCFALEYFDNTIKGPEDIEKLAGFSSLGVIPFYAPEKVRKKEESSNVFQRSISYIEDKFSNRKEHPQNENALQEVKNIELINYHDSKSSISEDYRTVRTSILLSHAEKPPKTILFTSSLPQEGKSATVANIAVAFSQLDDMVLVVDADLRNPQLHKTFNIKMSNKGLSGYLTGKVPLDKAIQKTKIENIKLLPSGLVPPNPAELLNSTKMKEMIEKVKKKYDIILIDSPPVLAVIDPVIISSLVDGTVIIVKAGKSERKPFLNTIEELKRAKANIVGVLFNALKIGKGDFPYMDFYRYYRYRYYRQEESEEETETGVRIKSKS